MMGYGGYIGPRPQPSPFWSQHCEGRGPALNHHHEQNCTDGHSSGQCCFCGADAKNYKPANTANGEAVAVTKITSDSPATSAGALQHLSPWPTGIRGSKDATDNYASMWEKLMHEARECERSRRPLMASKLRFYAGIVWACMQADMRDIGHRGD